MGNIKQVVDCQKVKMSRVWLLVTISLPWTVVSQHLGAGGLPGQRTPRTGAVWPPYEGAGQGYWARQAGFSLPFQQQSYQPAQATEQIQTTQQQQQFYTPQMVSGQTYWVPRQQLYTEQQQQQTYAQQQIFAQHQEQQQQRYAQQQLPYMQADQLRAQQSVLMQKYLSSSGNEVLPSTVRPKLLAGAGAGQDLYRFSTVDGALTQVELEALP